MRMQPSELQAADIVAGKWLQYFTRPHMHAHTHTHASTHTQTHTLSHESTHKHTHAHTHTHTHEFTQTHTHADIHVQIYKTSFKPQISYLSQTRKHTPHGLVVKTIRAVDDNDIHAKRLAKILRGFGFPSSSGSLRAAATVKVKGSGEGHVAAVSERSDDQAARVTKVFITILELGVGLSHDAVVILLQ